MIKVLVVDDSAIIRQILFSELSKAPDIQVIATASDPFIARTKILREKPDVITLDIEMPRMDGLTFLQQLMKQMPIPTIVLTSQSTAGGLLAMKALQAGAVDVMCKPGAETTVGEIMPVIIEQIRAASRVRFDKIKVVSNNSITTEVVHKSIISKYTGKIIAIGASTGGTVAIESILKSMPENAPGIVVVQHMPEKFTASFAERLNSVCKISVKEASRNDTITPGVALIAPGNYHMVVRRSAKRYYIDIKDGPRVFHQRPSVEVMFNSLAKYVGKNAIGILLTGMGTDGAQGLLSMKNVGSPTIAQDEESSVVWGMPGEAVKIGAADHVLPLDSITDAALKLVERDL
jgi:two-component system chemotaxis response regulator CheB